MSNNELYCMNCGGELRYNDLHIARCKRCGSAFSLIKDEAKNRSLVELNGPPKIDVNDIAVVDSIINTMEVDDPNRKKIIELYSKLQALRFCS